MNDPEHHDDPYPHYQQLRATCPVARSNRHGGYWIVSRHVDIATVLRDVHLFSSRRIRVDDSNSGMLEAGLRSPEGVHLGEPLALSVMDPPIHTDFRRLLVPLFSARRVQAWEPRIREAAADLCSRVAGLGSCDFSKEYAVEFPILVFLDILGVPHEDRHRMKELHDKLSLVPQGLISPEEARPFQIEELTYYAHLFDLDDPHAPLDETVVSWLNRAEVAGRLLTMPTGKTPPVLTDWDDWATATNDDNTRRH